jgi:hypothetical protein
LPQAQSSRRENQRSYEAPAKGASIDGLWVILVEEESAKVPMLARAGTGLYLLAFRTGFTARKFVADRGLAAGEPRMVVASSIPDVVSYMTAREVAGVLIDYDASTNTYKEAGLVY